MAVPVSVVHTQTSPLLRLPAELLLQITVEFVGSGPEPSHAPSYCCLEEFIDSFLRNQYALFKIPSFASLADQYPHAFTQNEAVVLIRNIEDARAHYHGHSHSPTKVQQGRRPGNHYICFGVDESHERIGWPTHVPSLAIADPKTVKVITNEVEKTPLLLLFRELVESRRLSTFKKMKLCVLVQKKRASQEDEGIFDLLSRDEQRRKKGAYSVLFLLTLMSKEGQGLEEVELEVYDQRGKGRGQRVVSVEFRKAMQLSGQSEWTYEDASHWTYLSESIDETLQAVAFNLRMMEYAIALLVVMLIIGVLGQVVRTVNGS